MFPDAFDLAPFKPLMYNNLLLEVLIPAARMIIQEDLSLTPLAAKKTMKDSHVFGTVYHPSSLDSPAVTDAVQRTTQTAPRVKLEPTEARIETESEPRIGAPVFTDLTLDSDDEMDDVDAEGEPDK
ncbi:hypothetical protein B0H13DRAFT_2325111 [Mycena leptocephala]|nr:hypothetical protein B0H13DRAFT_2325111 [Mycena leptocephala]